MKTELHKRPREPRQPRSQLESNPMKCLLSNSPFSVGGLLCSLTLGVSLQAAIIHVPEDQPTLQAAVKIAASGDELRIARACTPNKS